MTFARRSFPRVVAYTLPLVFAASVFLIVPQSHGSEPAAKASPAAPKASEAKPSIKGNHASIMPCASADIHRIHTSALSESQARGEGAPDTPALGIVDMAPSTTALGRGQKALLALGPVLGSMDSHDVKTKLTCTKDGMVMTATITRSSKKTTGTVREVFWRPQVSVVFVPIAKDMHIKTVWKMRLSNGKVVRDAPVPSHKTETYPIVFKKKVKMY